jgi:hypothetical protein
MALSGLVVGILVSAFFVETAPRKTSSVSMAPSVGSSGFHASADAYRIAQHDHQ